MNPEPPTEAARIPLYHYTSGPGFLSMLKSGQLWFTHIKYLNDSAEYTYALNLLMDVLQEYKGIGTQEHLQHAYDTIFKEKRLKSHYTFSLTERGDWLSQWRGYCPDGGYSFSINDQHLDQMRATYDLAFGKCLYDRNEQRQFIIGRIIGVPAEALKQADNAEKEAAAQGRTYSKGMDYQTSGMMMHIINNAHLLAFIKDPFFEEEREWRMVASEKDMSKTSRYLKYRSSQNMFIPYLELPIPTRSDNDGFHDNLIVDNVIISPTPHPDLALESCRMMMDHYQCKSVQSSVIPYRNW
jgi:hypothetical protein